MGSVKSNIGHTQHAAGVAGVIKMVEAMRHGVLPRTLHVDEPSPHVDWSSGSVELLTESQDWLVNGRPRRAGVSAFGISGTNAHVVLEEAPASEPVPAPVLPVVGPVVVPWVLSGRSAGAVRAAAGRLSGVSGEVVDVGWSLAAGRAVFDYRAVVTGRDRAGLVGGLGRVAPVRAVPSRVGLLFAGQGAQRAGMGRGLYEAFPVFAEAWDEVTGLLDPAVGEGALAGTDVVQPGLFAFEVALFRLLRSWGVMPDVLVGHSVGEFAVAHVAGVLSLVDACTLVSARGRLMQALPDDGVMVAVQASEEEVAPYLGSVVDLAAVNAAGSVVLSGSTAEVERVVAVFRDQGRRTRRLATDRAFHSSLMDPVLGPLAEVAAGLSYGRPQLSVVSTVTGGLVTEEMSSPQYWVDHVRRPVRFADAVAVSGAGLFLEVGPDGVLSGLVDDAVPLLRPDRAEPDQLVAALGEAFTRGVEVDWSAYFAGSGGKRVDLPTYPFQRDRYWLTPNTSADVSSVGLARAEHALLSGILDLADGGIVATGRVARDGQGWLPGALASGAAFVDLVLWLGDRAGCPYLARLATVSSVKGPARLQVVVGAVDEAGEREVTVDMRPEDADEWVRCATGVLTAASPPVPSGATTTALADLPEDTAPDGFLLHPALLDEVVREAADGLVPTEWAGVRVYTAGAASLRADVTALDDGALALALYDGAGELAASVASVTLTAAPPTAAATVDDLFHLSWRELPAADRADPADTTTWAVLGRTVVGFDVPAVADLSGLADLPTVPPVVLTRVSTVGEPAAAAHAAAEHALALAQSWLADERCAASRLVFVTVGASDGGDPAAAAVWGLIRSASSENPGRFGLVDTTVDDAIGDIGAVPFAEEPEARLRDGAVLVPRLVRTAGAGPRQNPGHPALNPEGTVLVTGGTGVLGALLARHLVTAHRVRSLLLAARRGPDAPGAAALRAELTELGARVDIVAADVADRADAARLLAAVPPEHPLTAVVHTAGTLDDGLIGSLTPERLHSVLRPKVDGAWHLHELTRGLDLSAFVVYSSASGLLGGPGQANYAAGNAFLDALARQRATAGQPALSLPWGLWADASAMTGHLGAADLRRLERGGLVRITAEEGMALFDAALAGEHPVAAPVKWDRRALRSLGAGLPALLGDLVPRRAGRRDASADRQDSPLAAITTADGAEREKLLLEFVRAEVAGVLGYGKPSAVPVDRAFSELGFDSLTAMELRNRLARGSGISLPATLVFDHPTVADTAGYLGERIAPSAGIPAPVGGVLEELARLEAAFARGPGADRDLPQAVARLERMLTRWRTAAAEVPDADASAERIATVSVDELFDIIDELDAS
ncbi:polyketide synthase [Streptomyces griseocarneus]|nr:polyketide synthase [Streptomyces griseocarneus]